MKEFEDNQKGEKKVKLELEKDNSINFLDIKLVNIKVNGQIETEQHQKEKRAEIYCNRRSDVDEGTKRNVIKNLERRKTKRGIEIQSMDTIEKEQIYGNVERR